MARGKKTHEEFIRDLNKVYGEDEYISLGRYINAKSKMLVRHNKCGYEWSVFPYSLLRGHGCPICGIKKNTKNRTKTHEEFIREVKEKYGSEYKVLGKYINSQTKVLVRHNSKKCNNHEWEVIPNNLLRGQGCSKCARNKKKTTEDFKKEIYDKYGNEYQIVGKYVNANTKILVKHNNCKNEWSVSPNHLLQGRGCPICSNPPKVIILGINTIWDTDRWMVDLGISEEDAKKYTRCSNKKITVKCPDCGKEKKIQISNIFQNKNISCSCGDGKSYPEKFVFNLLEQLDIEFETEYSPSWIDNKKYDFYIKDNSCIIETHGEQHYKQTSRRGKGVRTLQEEQANDKYKRDIALQNEIKHYIEINCRESNIDYIKSSILNSELSQLFDLSIINWNKCAEFANKNIVKEVCDYWNNKKEDETTSDIGKKFNLDRSSITNYLKKGIKLGWCYYNPKEEMRKIARQNGKTSGKKVEIFKSNKSLGIFESCAELERRSEELFGFRLNFKGIGRVCRGERKSYKGFTFKYVD